MIENGSLWIDTKNSKSYLRENDNWEEKDFIKELKKKSLSDEVTTIYRGDLQKGLYIYNLNDEDKLLKSGKIIFD